MGDNLLFFIFAKYYALLTHVNRTKFLYIYFEHLDLFQ